MNKIREIQRLNQRELENTVPPTASWHTDYRDTAYIYIGGLPLELSEGDIVTIFSQYGDPVWVRLMRDKETGKSRGFAWLKYEDQRSCDLAVDNLGGATVMGRLLAVDHTRYKRKEGEDETEGYVGQDRQVGRDDEDEGRRKRRRRSATQSESEEEERRPMIKEEIELAKLLREHDEDDPMKAYMVQQKREEVDAALKALAKTEKKGNRDRHRHRHHRSRRDREEDDEDRHRSHRRLRSPSEDGRDRKSDRHRSRRDRSETPRKEVRDRSETPRRSARDHPVTSRRRASPTPDRSTRRPERSPRRREMPRDARSPDDEERRYRRRSPHRSPRRSLTPDERDRSRSRTPRRRR